MELEKDSHSDAIVYYIVILINGEVTSQNDALESCDLPILIQDVTVTDERR